MAVQRPEKRKLETKCNIDRRHWKLQTRTCIRRFVVTRCAKNTKIRSQKSLKVSRFAMSLPGGATKNFNVGIQLHSVPYAKTSKACLKVYAVYWFWCAHTYQFRPIFSTTSTDLTLAMCPYANSYPNNFIYVHIYNTIATKCWWNFIYRLLINGRSRAHKLCGEISTNTTRLASTISAMHNCVQ